MGGGGDLYGFSVGGVAVRWSLMKGGVLGRLASPVQFSVFRYLSLCLGLSTADRTGRSKLSDSLTLWLAGRSLAGSQLVLHLYSLTHRRSSIPTRDAQP